MDHFEMVEKLRQKAQVSYEDAKASLEACNWDLLDALVYLEQAGKLQSEGKTSYSTRQEPNPVHKSSPAYSGGIFQRLFDLLVSLINRLNEVDLDIKKADKTLFSLPVIAFILLLVFAFWITLPLMVVGLFFGLRYRFKGYKGVENVNRVMDKAAKMAENIKSGANDREP